MQFQQESKSTVIFNEAYEIVQLRFQQQVGLLLISSIFRTVICERTRTGQWKLQQVGKKDRKLLSICGGTFLNNDRQQPTIICSRPGGRFWMADVQGTVQKTLVFKVGGLQLQQLKMLTDLRSFRIYSKHVVRKCLW